MQLWPAAQIACPHETRQPPSTQVWPAGQEVVSQPAGGAHPWAVQLWPSGQPATQVARTQPASPAQTWVASQVAPLQEVEKHIPATQRWPAAQWTAAQGPASAVPASPETPESLPPDPLGVVFAVEPGQPASTRATRMIHDFHDDCENEIPMVTPRGRADRPDAGSSIQ